MQRINEPLRPTAVSDHMKKKPVRNVLKQGPEKHTTEEGEKYPEKRVIQPCMAVIKHIHNHWKIHSPDHKRMCLGQHFQEIVLEQPCLAFIMNLFELHAAKIGKRTGESAPRKPGFKS